MRFLADSARRRVLIFLGIFLCAFFLALFSLFIAARATHKARLLCYQRAEERYFAGKYAETLAALSTPSCAPLLAAFDGAAGASLFVLRGKSFYFQGNFPHAEKEFKRARKMNPACAESRLYLARLLRVAGKREAAREVTQTLLRDDGSNVRALRLAALVEEDEVAANVKNKNDEKNALRAAEARVKSRAFLERAAAEAGELALVFMERARCRWEAGDTEGSRADLEVVKLLSAPTDAVYAAAESLEKTLSRFSAGLSAAGEDAES